MINTMQLSGGFIRSTILALCLLAGAILTTHEAWATPFPPERMTYQGFLVDANGDALGQGSPVNYDLVFSVWDEQNGGEAKWGEQQTVTVDKGYFSVLLGEGAAATGYTNVPLSSVFAGDASARYIEITVKGIGTDGADLTIRPRLQLVTSPYAFMARGTVPIGGIIMWSGTTVPDGWALCNGQTVGEQTAPDLRNRFIVGSGSTYPIGNKGGADSVTLTKAQMPSHNHGGTISHSAYQPGGNKSFRVGAWPAGSVTVSSKRYSSTHDHTIPSDGGNQAHENRPPYYALAFIMRVE